MVKEAMKTAEHHDSYDTITAEAERIADMIWSASHCVAFTGAGISTSAGRTIEFLRLISTFLRVDSLLGTSRYRKTC